jgi:Domain of unknown function (DUF4249)
MRASKLISIISILLLASCIDRINFDVNLPYDLPIAIDGHITNLPGPYQVSVSRSFDTQSTEYLRIPVSVSHIDLMDELGNHEELKEVAAGLYVTSPTGMQGRIGGVYKIRVELYDGRIYESLPDTILMPGRIDSLYHDFNLKLDAAGEQQYGFDLKVDAVGNSGSETRYMWNLNGTFKAITHPEIYDPQKPQGCYPIPEDFGKCNFIPLCTGLRNVAPRNAPAPSWKEVGPCECCTCWYKLFNSAPILSDNILTAKADYQALFIDRIPLDQWIFMFKIHTEVLQSTLTNNSFRFFKSIRDQKNAIGSLFQPITGKVPNNFIQITGTATPVNGIFYAAGVATKGIYITRDDVPNQSLIPEVDFNIRGNGWFSCTELFPDASTTKPEFWVD